MSDYEYEAIAALQRADDCREPLKNQAVIRTARFYFELTRAIVFAILANANKGEIDSPTERERA